MQDKFFNIQGPGECISEEMMLNYLEGKLSPAEQHRVEKHLLDCEICSDALEGLQSQSRAQIKNALDEIDSRIGQRISEAKRNGSARQSYYRIAAAIAAIILFGGGLYYLQSIKKSEKIFTENFQPYHDTTSITTPIVAASPEEKKIKEESRAPHKNPGPAFSLKDQNGDRSQTGSAKQTDETINKKNSQDDLEKQPTTTNAEEDKIKGEPSAEKKEVPAPSANAEVTRPQTFSEQSKATDAVSKNQSPASPETRDNTTVLKSLSREKNSSKQLSPAAENEISVVADTSKTSQSGLTKEGIRLYEEKKYADAITVFESVLKNESANSEALFYSGVSNLSLNEDAVAIRLLESVLKNSPDRFSDAAKWYLSLAYIKRNKMAKAKKLLEDLSTGNGEYKTNAAKTLRELK